ncbi:rhodanese-like domain-containing protein [Streptomyces sp. NPDC056144]|uniref:rhodanese-like domain-containing protein n=1 Tax=unclassified Streptomyces TaxID=2593676 RepID=UPI0035D94B66
MAQRISRDELKKKIDEKVVVVVEALPASYYNERHLPGALNLPHDQVDELAPSLLPNKEAQVAVYCSDGPCPNSGIAAERLVELGYTNVFEYYDGKSDWVEAGLPVETGA